MALDRLSARLKPDDQDYGVACDTTIMIDGQQVRALISTWRLEQSVDRHDLLELHLLGIGGSGADDMKDPNELVGYLGKSIALKAVAFETPGEPLGQCDFVGIITEVRVEGRVNASSMAILTAHGPTIKMDGPCKSKTFLNTKASDVISSVVGDCGMTANVDASSVTHDYIAQHAETDYEFIKRLAAEDGKFAFYSKEKLHVISAKNGDHVKANWPNTLGGFSLGIGSGVYSFRSVGWDETQKQQLLGDAKKGSQRGASGTWSGKSLTASEQIYPSDESLLLGDQNTTQAEAENQAKAALETSIAGMSRCSGTSIVPDLIAGKCINVSGMGGRADGLYWVTQATHTFSDSGTYRNQFECSAIDAAYPKRPAKKPYVPHLHTAVVVDNVDPEHMGRVKVKTLYSDDQETTWARVVQAGAGNERGSWIIPEIDDEVLIAYTRGDVDHPIVFGGLYNGQDAPPPGTADTISDGSNNLRLFRSRSGHVLQFDDTDGSEKIDVLLKDEKTVISLTMESGTGAIVISSDSDISVKAENNVAVEATNDITLKAGGKITLEATGDIDIKSQGNIKNDAGVNFEAKSNAAAKVETSGQLDVKGAMTSVKGDGIVEIKGGLVKIN